MPFKPTNDTMTTAALADICGVSGIGAGGVYDACNFYAPGSSGGKVPEFSQLTSGTKGYNVDWNNFAPNLGFAWRPEVENGWLRALLGDPQQATIRGGYAESFERQGIGGFTGIYGPNPGSTLSLTRNANTGIVGPGETWPVLLSQTDRLYQAPFPESPTFPIAIRPNRADDINAFHPDIQVASARSWTVGVQRAISTNMAFEARYVGTRGVNQWSTLNYNERNVIENGFLDEFKLAMRNLEANNRAGGTRAGSFAYFGSGQRHHAAADLSRLPERKARRGQPDRLHRRRRDVEQRHPRGAARADQPESELCQLDDGDLDRRKRPQQQCRRRPRQQSDLPQQRARRGTARELLRRQSPRQRRQHPRQRRVQHLSSAADSSCGAACQMGWLSTAAISTRSRKDRNSSASISGVLRATSMRASGTR